MDNRLINMLSCVDWFDRTNRAMAADLLTELGRDDLSAVVRQCKYIYANETERNLFLVYEDLDGWNVCGKWVINLPQVEGIDSTTFPKSYQTVGKVVFQLIKALCWNPISYRIAENWNVNEAPEWFIVNYGSSDRQETYKRYTV